MIYCQVENGVVVNRAEFAEPMPDDWPDRESWIEEDEAQIGWAYADGVFTPPPPPPEPEPPPPAPPSPDEIVLFNHENRLRTMEGVPPLTLVDFVELKRSAK